MARSVDEAFPHLTEWVTTHGWIEIGYDDYPTLSGAPCQLGCSPIRGVTVGGALPW